MERDILQRAQVIYKRDILALEKLLHRQHIVNYLKKFVLSRILVSQGQWKEAEKIMKQVIELCEGSLSINYTTELRVKSQLARIYREQGNLIRARKLDEHVLEKMLRTFPPGTKTPYTLGVDTNWTRTNWGNRQPARLVEDLIQLVNIHKRVMGLEHYNTLGRMVELGCAYQQQGKAVEAERMFT